MLPGNHHQSDQSTGHICFNVLQIVCPTVSVFWVIHAGSDLLNGGGGGAAVFVSGREDDIAGLDSGHHSQRIPFRFAFSSYIIVVGYRTVYTYRICALERAHE